MIYGLSKALISFILLFYRVTVTGKENEPKDGAYIVYAHHKFALDVFILISVLNRKIRFIAKRALFKIPVVGFVVKKFGSIPADRIGRDVDAVKQALAVLSDGGVFGIFPEGTRVKKGRTAEPKGGIALIAKNSGAPLLPVKIEYLNGKRIFGKINVTVGKPFYISELGYEAENSADYKKQASELMERLDRI